MRLHILLIFVTSGLVLLTILDCKSRQTFVDKRLDVSTMPQLRSLSITGSNQASVVVGLMASPRDLRLTTDAGQTWRVIRTEQGSQAFECATLKENNRGWAVSRLGQVFNTTSAGMSWTMISDVRATSQGDFKGCQQVEFPSDTDGWILEGLSIWRTKDGGSTWVKSLSVKTPGVKGQPVRIYVIDVNTLVCAGTEGQVYLTKDGGGTWKIETLINADADFRDIGFFDRQKGFVVGYVGEPSFRPLLFVTTNGGEAWREISIEDLEIHPLSVSFVGDEGWLAGRKHPKRLQPSGLPQALLLHTTDGGLHWAPVVVGDDDPFFSFVRFADKDHGWLVGRDNLYRTDDAGRTWKVTLSLTPIQNSDTSTIAGAGFL